MGKGRQSWKGQGARPGWRELAGVQNKCALRLYGLGEPYVGAGEGEKAWLLLGKPGSPESWICTTQCHGRGLRSSSVSLSSRAKTLGLMNWLPLVSPSSETGLPFMSMLGVTSSFKAQQDLDGVGIYLGTWMNRALLVCSHRSG